MTTGNSVSWVWKDVGPGLDDFRGHVAASRVCSPWVGVLGLLQCLTHFGLPSIESEVRIANHIPLMLHCGVKEPILFLQQSKLLKCPH